jgi:chaperonin GroES
MTKSGLYIPDAAKEKPTMGTVVVTGPGKINTNPGIPNRYLPLEVKKGNKILYGQFAGTVVKIDSEEFILLREEDVMGVIED